MDGNPIESIYFKNIIALKNLYMNDLTKLYVVEDKAFSNVIGRAGDDNLFEQTCFSLYLSNCASLRKIEEGAFDATTLCMVSDVSEETRFSKSGAQFRYWKSGSGSGLRNTYCS